MERFPKISLPRSILQNIRRYRVLDSCWTFLNQRVPPRPQFSWHALHQITLKCYPFGISLHFELYWIIYFIKIALHLINVQLHFNSKSKWYFYLYILYTINNRGATYLLLWSADAISFKWILVMSCHFRISFLSYLTSCLACMIWSQVIFVGLNRFMFCWIRSF